MSRPRPTPPQRWILTELAIPGAALVRALALWELRRRHHRILTVSNATREALSFHRWIHKTAADRYEITAGGRKHVHKEEL